MGHSGQFKNGPLPPKWACPVGGTGRASVKPASTHTSPAPTPPQHPHLPSTHTSPAPTPPRRPNGNPSRTGRYGWGPGNRALSSGKCDGGATMGIYNERRLEKMTKKLCTDLFRLGVATLQSRSNHCPTPSLVLKTGEPRCTRRRLGPLMGGLVICAEVSRGAPAMARQSSGREAARIESRGTPRSGPSPHFPASMLSRKQSSGSCDS
jgi:hypothetical protein